MVRDRHRGRGPELNIRRPLHGGAAEVRDVVDEVHERFLTGSGHRREDVATAVALRAPHLGRGAQAAVADEVLARLGGLGQLAELFDDDSINDVMINGPGAVTVERCGRLEVVGSIGAAELDRLVEYLLAPTGRRVDRRSPVVDVRLDDRTRCHIAVPPVAVDGPCISLRRFPQLAHPLDRFGAPDDTDRVRRLIHQRANLLVFGPTGTGKTSLIASALAMLGDTERVVIVEEAAELPAGGAHMARLEAQPPNLDGVGGVTLAHLVATALRMRPDRIVVGEVRGPEAAGLLHALSTGHRGSMGTLHADSLEGSLWRFEQLAIAGGASGDVAAQIRRSVDYAVEMRRGPGAERHIAAVHAVCGAGVSIDGGGQGVSG